MGVVLLIKSGMALFLRSIKSLFPLRCKMIIIISAY